MADIETNGVDTNGQAQAPATPQHAAAAAASNDALVCQWSSCGERLPSAEELYDHVCERHVGRKSTNNLNLTCQWGNCRTTTVKRDHITSHIRVHVPLKPHKCDFCGKAFKRPQDLKKHVKTHADDSVLLRSPEPNRSGHGAASYSSHAGKLVADLQSLAATASGYYPDHHALGGQPVYYSGAAATPAGYHGGSAPQQGSAYGPVYYAVSQPSNVNAEYELRKRAAFDALNEFFGDAKRRMIDPTTYYDVGQRLASLNSVQLPMLNGYSNGGVSDYHSAGSHVASQPQPLLQQQYSLPLPNLRTKADLINIDQFLDQLQTTVYENSNQAAAAGVAQPGSHYVSTHMDYKSHSPPSMHHSHHSAHTSAVTPSGASNGPDTPALTPASSVLSYPSVHSPGSVHSQQTISPISRSSISSMYPTLPSVSSMADMPSYHQTSGAPSAGLASAFDADGRRRYSGGQLQKSRVDSEMSSPTTPRAMSIDKQLPQVDKLGLNSPSMKSTSLDPALRSPPPGRDTDASDEADRTSEAWVENIRIIEALRSFIKEKLDKGDYENGAAAASAAAAEAPASTSASAVVASTEQEDMDTSEDAKSLYPVLRELQGDNA